MKEGYAICFNEWALDKEINGELGLLLIISSLSAETGYCYASNEYLANLFNTTEITISRKIHKLKEKNYISIEYEKRGAEIKKRFIRLTKLLTDDYQNCKPTINKNVKENNININNTSINNKLNEFNLYNNFNENEQCDCISKSTKQRCSRKSSFNINGKNYCNQHARSMIPNISNSFTKPTLEEVKAYCLERNNNVDAETFYDYFETGGWVDSKGNKVKNWKQKIITWEKNTKKESRYERERRLLELDEE